MIIKFSELKQRMIKSKFYYVINQGEYMNKYTDIKKQESIESQDEKQSLITRVIEYCLSKEFFRFTNFEIEEIEKVAKVIDSFDEGDPELQDILGFVFEDDEYSLIKSKIDVYDKELSALNFSLKSLNLQRKELLSNFDLSKVVKLGDKIFNINEKIHNIEEDKLKVDKYVLDCYSDFYNKYLDLLKYISENISANIKNKIDDKKFGKKILDFYKFNKFFYFINSVVKDIDIQMLILNLTHNKEFAKFFGDKVDLVKNKLAYVGTDI